MAGLRVCFELSILNVLLATAPETDIIEATDESEREHFIMIKLLIQSDVLLLYHIQCLKVFLTLLNTNIEITEVAADFLSAKPPSQHPAFVVFTRCSDIKINERGHIETHPFD